MLLPAEVVRRWGLRPGEVVEISFDADRLILRPAAGDREAYVKALQRVLEEDDAILSDVAGEARQARLAQRRRSAP